MFDPVRFEPTFSLLLMGRFGPPQETNIGNSLQALSR